MSLSLLRLSMQTVSFVHLQLSYEPLYERCRFFWLLGAFRWAFLPFRYSFRIGANGIHSYEDASFPIFYVVPLWMPLGHHFLLGEKQWPLPEGEGSGHC